MSFLSRAILAWDILTKDASDGPYGQLAAFLEVYGSTKSKSGQTINYSTALQVATVLGICRVLGDGIAQVPLKVFRDRADGRGADPAVDHPLYQVLYRRPNPWQTSFAFRETMMLHLVLCGNFFAYKNRVGSQIRELVPFQPGNVEVTQHRDLSLTYRVRDPNGGQMMEFQQADILHLRGLSWNSWMGMEAIKLARESIGLSMAIEADQAALYKNGLRTSGTYSVEGKLDGGQYERLQKFIQQHRETSGAPLILDRAAKYLAETMTGVDAQTLESRRHQVEEVCRPFRVMPIMVGHADKAATYASAEQMFLAHVVHTLCPWYERLQQDFDVQLLTDAERAEGLYTKFIVNALMRGTAEARASYYKAMLGAPGQKGWGSQNEVRALEEMNLSSDPDADSIAQPVRITEAVTTPPASEGVDQPNPGA